MVNQKFLNFVVILKFCSDNISESGNINEKVKINEFIFIRLLVGKHLNNSCKLCKDNGRQLISMSDSDKSH